ncbi:hypothetical protein CHS0354_042403 [Potamilus streckersoni]|uniref:Uncharacterized protein n=1 Tax=Potamilus streckersoni TaxID=2493646 RepID=A0AAE0W2M6_9BIVA|nr:hypothetical protein CHS0354_042403 [Potamilus streckersoni]
MDVALRIFLSLILCAKEHAKDLNLITIVQGNNAIVYIDTPKTDGKNLLEIYFSGCTSNQHLNNVLLYTPVNGENGRVSINTNYKGRIDRVVHNNDEFSFLLLNTIFNDSGNYTVNENSNVIGITSVLVARRIFVAQLLEPFTLSFTFYDKNTLSIRVDSMTSKLSQLVVIYNATNDSCTYVVSWGKNNIRNCTLRKGEFSFIISEIVWLNKGTYFAWDDKGRLLDSLYLDIQDTGTSTTSSRSDIGNEMGTSLIVSALLIMIFASCLAIVAMWKLRRRRARMSTNHNFTHRNEIQTIGCGPDNALFPDETRIVLATNNSRDLTELKRNKIEERVKLNDQNMCVRGLGCRKSYGNARWKLQIDSTLSSAETIQSDSTHRYDYVPANDEWQPKQSYIRSNLLGTNSIGSTSQSSFQYKHVGQSRFMILRPPAPDPVVKKNNKQQNIVADSFYSIKKCNKRWLPRDDPSTLFAKKSNKMTMEIHRTRSSDELSLDCINVVSSPCFVQLDKDFAKKDVESPQKSRKVKCIKSKDVGYMPESCQFRDSKTRSASQCLSANYPRDDYDYTNAMETRHRISWSNDDLYEYGMSKTKAPQLRRFSASFCMDEDYYDCLDSSCNT